MNALAILRALPAVRARALAPAPPSVPAVKSSARPSRAVGTTYDAAGTCRVCGFARFGTADCQCAQIGRDLIAWLGAKGPQYKEEIRQWHSAKCLGTACDKGIALLAKDRLDRILVDLREHGLISCGVTAGPAERHGDAARSAAVYAANPQLYGAMYAKAGAEPPGWTSYGPGPAAAPPRGTGEDLRDLKSASYPLLVWELDRLARAFPELQPGLLPFLRRTSGSAFEKLDGDEPGPPREELLEAVKRTHRAAGQVRRREEEARRGADALRLAAVAARAAPPPSKRVGTVPRADAGLPVIVLVSCSDEKRETGERWSPASTVYASSLFRMSLDYARTLVSDDRIRILSAKWGAIGVDQYILSYDFQLHSMSKTDREAWGGRVVSGLVEDFGGGPLRVIVLAGEKYVEAVRAGAAQHNVIGWTFELPFGDRVGERLRVGERRGWLRGQLDHAGSPARLTEAGVPAAGSPEEDLAAAATFLRDAANREQSRSPTHHRPAPHQARIANVLREAGATIQRRGLDRHGAIAYLRDLSGQWKDNDDIALAGDRLLTLAKGIERGKHLAAAARP